jgi:predicted transcriptional regulator of viral defense system
MKVEGFFVRHPVFTWDEFATFYAARGTAGRRSAEALLAYHTRAGHLLRARRGLYAVVPVGMSPDAAPVDPYLLATRMKDDAVLAYHTALDVHGTAYSAHDRVVFVTTHAARLWSFRSIEFRPVQAPRALLKQDVVDVQVTTVDRAGLNVRVTTLERALVDVLDRPDLGGGWEEVWRSLEAVSFFDLDAVADYALLLGNSTTIAKVGFFLEQHRQTLAVEEHHLQRLRAHRPRQPHYASRHDSGESILLRDWNLVVPVALVERPWQEIT